MRALRSTAVLAAVSLAAGAVYVFAQQGPQSQSSETVAKPRKKDAGDATAASPDGSDLPKIPSKFNKKDTVPENLPNFKSDVTAIQLEVSVLDNRGNFLPGIPKDKFRVLEDGVPQKITTFSTTNDAPMTVALVI